MEQLLSDKLNYGMSLRTHRPYRLAILSSHVIQYQAPLFRTLAAHPDLDLTVLFCSDWGLETYWDDGFGREVKWDVPLIEGYQSDFIPNWSPQPRPSRFFGLVNPGVIKRLRTGNFDAVLVHGWSRLSYWLTMLTAFGLDIPVLLRGESNVLNSPPALKAAAKQAVLTTLFKKVAAFLAIGRYSSEFYQLYGVPKEKIFLTPYAVDNDFFLSKADELLPHKNELKHKLGIGADMPVILFSGKLTPVKRPLDLLNAFEEVSKSYAAALIYVGDGPLRSSLEEYARQKNLRNVHFVGFQNQTEFPRFFAMADIFVLPSRSEPWGLVVNEAMCFGLPVIVSDRVGAGGDLVRHGVNGLVYRVADVTSLAEMIQRLLKDSALRQRMREASHTLIRRWSYKEDVEGFLECLGDVVGATRKQ